MHKDISKISSTLDLDNLSINTIRFLAIDAIRKANSGHPGLPMGAAAFAYILWTRFIKHNPSNPKWFDRDRFVLSAGHGSALLYSLLHLSGYDLPLDQIKQFRQWGSLAPGHPERGITPGVEVTTGPLGQGFGNSVGMAVAEAFLSARYNRPGYKLIDHYTYVLASDGDLMEGVAAEAASLAGAGFPQCVPATFGTVRHSRHRCAPELAGEFAEHGKASSTRCLISALPRNRWHLCG